MPAGRSIVLPDSFGAFRKFRILAVIDNCCRENRA